ncbi:AraC family transcriptional regulator [Hydrogenispora ethanolica]|uniref:AraC family transcriptional regulator n=1 Tax=Hydrogenispora ethanolica TaxID=1082276 RepID=A0A4R1S2D8_HYDET|nr:AraC family transcriptional regulator [Hydrogenispora ethanolica]TCL73179.1 AraC family transcriptional regulator [Hydrogenispora ethanolica]
MFGSEVEVLWIALYYYQPGDRLGEHHHDCYQIFYIIAGRGEFNAAGRRVSLGQDMLLLVRSNQIHSMINQGKETLKTLDIKFNIIDPALQARLDALPECVFSGLTEVRTALESVREEGRSKEPFYKELSAVHLMKILLLLLRQAERAATARNHSANYLALSEQDPVCEKVIHYLQEHYAEAIVLKDLAKSLGYTQSYVCQCFRRELHCSPLEYLHQYRIEKAKEYILYSDYSIKQIAEMIGISNIHHFTRLFRRMVGLAPGRWREREREGIRKNIYISDTFVNPV